MRATAHVYIMVYYHPTKRTCRNIHSIHILLILNIKKYYYYTLQHLTHFSAYIYMSFYQVRIISYYSTLDNNFVLEIQRIPSKNIPKNLQRIYPKSYLKKVKIQ